MSNNTIDNNAMKPDDLDKDGLSNLKGFLKNEGIYSDQDGFIYLPLGGTMGTSYSFSLYIDNSSQSFSVESNEILMYRHGNLVSTAHLGDLKYRSLHGRPIKDHSRSDKVINSAVPYFFRNIFLPIVGSSKSMLNYTPDDTDHRTEVSYAANYEQAKSQAERNCDVSGIAYGCIHFDAGNFHKDYAVVDTRKLYYVTVCHGSNCNAAIFINFRCRFKFNPATKVLDLIAVPDDDTMEERERNFTGYIYFNHKTTTNMKACEAFVSVLNTLLGNISHYYYINPRAFEVWLGGKLISEHEETEIRRYLKMKSSPEEKEVARKAILRIFNRFIYRYCPETIVQWAMMFAIQDGKVDTDENAVQMANMMLHYRRKPQYSPKVFAPASFDKLPDAVTLVSIEGVYYAYNLQPSAMSSDANGKTSTFRVTKGRGSLVDGSAVPKEFVCHETTRPKGFMWIFRRFFSGRSAAKVTSGLTFVHGKEVRVTKVVSRDELLQKVMVDNQFVDFVLLSKRARDPNTLYIIERDGIDTWEEGLCDVDPLQENAKLGGDACFKLLKSQLEADGEHVLPGDMNEEVKTLRNVSDTMTHYLFVRRAITMIDRVSKRRKAEKEKRKLARGG